MGILIAGGFIALFVVLIRVCQPALGGLGCVMVFAAIIGAAFIELCVPKQRSARPIQSGLQSEEIARPSDSNNTELVNEI